MDTRFRFHRELGDLKTDIHQQLGLSNGLDGLRRYIQRELPADVANPLIVRVDKVVDRLDGLIREMHQRYRQAQARHRIIDLSTWVNEGIARFGPDRSQWRWLCPVCREVCYLPNRCSDTQCGGDIERQRQPWSWMLSRNRTLVRNPYKNDRPEPVFEWADYYEGHTP